MFKHVDVDALYLGLPPCGGSGLKCLVAHIYAPFGKSPSVWREWIEMLFSTSRRLFQRSPSVWREWIEIS